MTSKETGDLTRLSIVSALAGLQALLHYIFKSEVKVDVGIGLILFLYNKAYYAWLLPVTLFLVFLGLSKLYYSSYKLEVYKIFYDLSLLVLALTLFFIIGLVLSVKLSFAGVFVLFFSPIFLFSITTIFLMQVVDLKQWPRILSETGGITGLKGRKFWWYLAGLIFLAAVSMFCSLYLSN